MSEELSPRIMSQLKGEAGKSRSVGPIFTSDLSDAERERAINMASTASAKVVALNNVEGWHEQADLVWSNLMMRCCDLVPDESSKNPAGMGAAMDDMAIAVSDFLGYVKRNRVTLDGLLAVFQSLEPALLAFSLVPPDEKVMGARLLQQPSPISIVTAIAQLDDGGDTPEFDAAIAGADAIERLRVLSNALRAMVATADELATVVPTLAAITAVAKTNPEGDKFLSLAAEASDLESVTANTYNGIAMICLGTYIATKIEAR